MLKWQKEQLDWKINFLFQNCPIMLEENAVISYITIVPKLKKNVSSIHLWF